MPRQEFKIFKRFLCVCVEIACPHIQPNFEKKILTRTPLLSSSSLFTCRAGGAPFIYHLHILALTFQTNHRPACVDVQIVY